jgi:pimeloyl-ACP methyl ester carboxylesterase
MLSDYADCVIRTIDQLHALGHRQVVLVGHSLAGATLTVVAERVPERLSCLIYLTAWLPFDGHSVADMRQLPEAAGSAVTPLIRSLPAAAKALRIDFDSPDAAYLAAVKASMYHDASDEAFEALRRNLTPDEPTAPQMTPIHKTAAAWGSVPRHYIKCLQDRALPPAMAQRMIDGADSESPGKPTQVHTLPAGHSPFLSMPAELAALLSRIAGG